MNQKIIAVVLALLSATALYYSTVEHKDAFQQWKQDFRMVFSQEEDAYRRIIFMKNLELI